MRRTVIGSPKDRMTAFLCAFRDADDDIDIVIRIGRTDVGEPGLLVSFCGSEHALMATDARQIADLLEEGMRSAAEGDDISAFPDIIMGLRHAANAAEAKA